MKKPSILLFTVITALFSNSCVKEDIINNSSQVIDPLEIKENVLVKKITLTEEQGYVQKFDFRYDGNKIVSIESEEERLIFFYLGRIEIV